MNKSLNRIFILSLFLSFVSTLFAAAPAGYYKTAEGKTQKALLQELCAIVGPHHDVGYDGLWNVYRDSDLRPGTNEVWDMYSTVKYNFSESNQCHNYKNVGDCYNREHSFPQSWFGKSSPMRSDAYHIYPTDGKVNGQRSSYPYGECKEGTTLTGPGGVKGLGKLGTSTFPGYTGKVFEPVDEYKGDFARSYFYMAAAYNNRFASFSSPMLAGNNYPCYTGWAVNLLLKWHRQDPVSEKEINRNEAVYKHQRNRNPFIDHPELAEYIWGTKQGEGWVPGGSVDPVITAPVNGSTIDLGIALVNTNMSQQITVKSAGLKENLNVTVAGTGFSVSTTTVSKDLTNKQGANITVSYQSANAGEATGVLTISSSEVTSQVNLKATTAQNLIALPAESVTMDAFTARWSDLNKDGSNYNLYVYLSDGKTLLPGYPKTVAAAAERYDVTGLDYSATYKYKVTDKDGKESNIITVKTNDPIRSIDAVLPTGGLVFQVVPDQASEILPVDFTSEYILENEITVSISGAFEISLDKTNWKKELTIAADGERVFVHLPASAEGTYKGVLSASTPTVEGCSFDVIAKVAAPRSFFEDFEVEKSGSSGYNDNGAEITGNACKWYMKNVGVYSNASNDHLIDKFGVRTGKSGERSFEMSEDKIDGAHRLSFQAALYGSDVAASFEVLYATKTKQWTKLETFNVTSPQLQEFGVDVDIHEAVRFKFNQLTGKRINFDNIEISDISGVENVYAENNNWDAYVLNGKVCVELENDANILIYTTDAKLMYQGMTQNGNLIELPQGIYIVVNEAINDSRKVIVK